MIVELLWAAAALAKPPAEPAYATPTHVDFWRQKVDWEIAQNEAVGRLAEYITLETVNPPGNESRGVEFLSGVLDQESIPYRLVDLAEGRSSLIARVDGIGADTPLCLVHHIDTVGFDDSEWDNAYQRGPLSGAQSNGYVWGRGALGGKGMGAIELMTLVWLKRLDVPLIRDVVLLAIADSEVDNEGAKQLAGMWDEIGCSHLINEGGMGVHGGMFDGQSVHSISTAEKGVLWVDMHADGRPGDGSTPYPDEAMTALLAAMTAIADHQPKYVIDDDVSTLLQAVGAHAGGGEGSILKNPGLTKMFGMGPLKRRPAVAATMIDTMHLTGVRGAQAPNEVPERVTATYDCRLLPGTTPEAQLELMKELTVGIDGISFEVLREHASNGSSSDDRLFDVIAHYATEERPHAVAGPWLSAGFTDALYLRPAGVKAYGYVPFEVTQELAASVDGPDERVPVDEVREGLRRLFSMVVDFAGNP